MRTSKKVLFMLVLLITCIIVFGVAFADTANQQSPLAIDLIVVMEHSWAVSNGKVASDPSGYRYDAAAASINMCDTKYSRANYLLFNEKFYSFSNGKTGTINKNALSLFDISMALGRSNRFEMLNELTAANKARNLKTTGGADIGSALLAAVDTQLQENSKNKKVIIIMIDGESSFPGDNRTKYQVQKLMEGSNNNIITARTKAEENGITIHAVLLKDKSTMDFVQSEFCTSDGLFAFVSDPEQLPGVFVKMISENIGSQVSAANGPSRKSSETEILVPNSSIAEMNIIIPVSNIDVSSLQLISPAGIAMGNDENNCYSMISPYNAFYKVILPDQGSWKIVYDGDESNSNITTQYIFGYDLIPAVSLSTTRAGKSEPVVVSSLFEKDGLPVHDELLYQIPAKVMLMKDGRVIKSGLANSSADGYEYTFDSLKDVGAGDYTVIVQYEGEGLIRESVPQQLTISNIAPVLVSGASEEESYTFTIDTPGKEESYEVQTKEWDLSKIVSDPDGDKLTWTIRSAPEGILTSIRESILTISTIKNTTAKGDVVVTTKDSDGEEGPSIVYHIKVVSDSDAVDTIVFGPTSAITKSNDAATIKVQYVIDGMTLTVGDYYNIPAILTLKKDNNILLSGIQMVYDGNAYIYTFTDLKKYGPGRFEADVRLFSGSFSRDCTPFEFEMVNKAPKIKEDMLDEINCTFRINNPEDQDSYQIQNETFDLSTYAYDPDGDPLTWHIESNKANVKAAILGSNLSISTIQDIETKGDIVVSATDSDGDAGAEITFHISVSSVEAELEIAVSGPSKPVKKDEPVTISAQLIQNGKNIAKDSRLNTIPASLSIRKGEDIIYSALAMSCENGIFSCTLTDLKKNGAGEYTAIIRLQSGYFTMSSKPFTFVLFNDAPKLVNSAVKSLKYEFEINIPGNSESYQPIQWKADLSKYVYDPNGDVISWEIIENTADVDASIVKNDLIVTTRPNKVTKGTITIIPEDLDGDKGPELKADITVRSIENELEIVVSGLEKPIKKDEAFTIEAQLMLNGKSVAKDTRLNAIPATMSLRKGDKIINSDLTLDCEDGSYSCTVTDLYRNGAGEYNGIITLQTDNFSMSSGPFAFVLSNDAPKLVNSAVNLLKHEFEANIPGNGESYQPMQWKADLSKYVDDPNGDAISWEIIENTADVDASIEKNDLIVTTRPNKVTKGTITVLPVDSDGDKGPEIMADITVYSVENELEIVVTGPTKPVKKDAAFTIKAQLMRNGKSVTKDTRLNSIPATISVRKGEDIIYSARAMDCEDGAYSCTVTDMYSNGAGEYNAIITLQTDNFIINSEPVFFELSNDIPKLADPNVNSVKHEFEINIPGNSESYKRMQWKEDLSKYIYDPNGDAISWEIIKNTADVDVSIDGNELTVTTRPNKVTNGIITVLPADSDGDNGPEISAEIAVVSIEEVYDRYTAAFLPVYSSDKNSDIPLSLHIYNENGDRVDNDYYLPAEITATVTNPDESDTVVLARDDMGSYTGNFHSGNLSKEYQIDAEVTVGEKSIKSKTLTFSTINRAPINVRDIADAVPKTMLLVFGSDYNIQLNDYFNDPDNDILSYEITDNTIGEHADLTVEDQILKIQPKSGIFCLPFTGRFAVKAIDTEGAEAGSTVVEITIWPVLLMLLMVFILIAAIFALIKYMAWKNACFGDAAFEVSYGYMGLELPDELSKVLPSGEHTAVTLDGYCTEQAEKITGEAIQKELLKAISLKPLSKGRIQVILAENSAMTPFEDRPVYRNDQYLSSKPIKKNHILRPNESIFLYSDKYYLKFMLVYITKEK